MVEKYCKCGHNRLNHKKHPEKKLSGIGYCRNCPCTEYMNRDLPNLTSKITFIIGIIIFGTFGALTIMILSFVYAASFTLEWNEPIKEITTGTYLTILSATLVICNLLFLFVGGSLFGFLTERKRPNYPIGEMI